MSTITELSLASSDITLDVTKIMGFLDANGRHDAGQFGIDSQGRAYVDTVAVTPGETAALGWDPSTSTFVIATRPDVYEIRAQMFWLPAPRGETEPHRPPTVSDDHAEALRRRAPLMKGMGVKFMVGQVAGRSEVNCAPGRNAMPEQPGPIVPGCMGRNAMPQHTGPIVSGCVGTPRWSR